MALHALSLCAGIGSLDLALRELGVARTVCYVEREPYAVDVLRAGIEAGRLDDAPIWDDLCTFDAQAWSGRVDVVFAGLPCQPYSLAGKRRGHDDERALWPEFVRIVVDCRPAVVFLENVPPFLKHAEPVWRELRGMGFEWAPPLLLTASHVGAIHRRKRVFLLAAHPDRRGRAGWPQASIGSAIERAPAQRDHRVAPDSDRSGFEREWCGWVFDRERQTFRHDADRCHPRCRIAGSAWASESPVCRVDDGPPHRARQLRALGNAIVPQVAALAWQTLSEQLRGPR